MENVTKAVIILWLTEMKQKGEGRITTLENQLRQGAVEEHQLEEAGRRYRAILALIEIFQACPLEPAEMLEKMKELDAELRQGKLFSQIKNPV